MKIDNRKIFEAIGHLLYAIVLDQRVKPLEEGELKLLISERLPRNNNGIVSDEAHYLMTTMDELESTNTGAADAFFRFTKFNSLHPQAFTKELKAVIVTTAEDILRIFKSDNPGDNNHFNLLKELWTVNQLEKA